MYLPIVAAALSLGLTNATAQTPKFRGALVYKSHASQAIKPGLEGITPVTFDAVVYDTCSCWDASRSRMVVPPDVRFVRLSAQAIWTYPDPSKITPSSVRQIVIKQNFETIDNWYRNRPGWAVGQTPTHSGTTVDVSARGPVLPVSPGDDFTVTAFTADGAGAEIMAINGTWFAIEIIE